MMWKNQKIQKYTKNLGICARIFNFAQIFQYQQVMGKFTAFKVPIKSLPQGVHHFDYHLDKTFFSNMESADIHDADLSVSLDVTYKSDMYSLDFAITGTVTLLCDRCLDDLIFPIDTTYHITVKYGEDYNDESDELLVIPETDNYLNVAYMLYDTVALAIPMKHVHPAGKCNRQMSAVLKRHSAGSSGDSIEDELIEEIDDIDMKNETEAKQGSDSRWDALKDFNPED